MIAFDKNDIAILARTIYGEARGEFLHPKGGIKSLQAIAWVVKNRFTQKKFGKTIQVICKKPWQFSCWNEGDPNRLIIENVKPDNGIFQQCMIVANDVLTDKTVDCTYGADHYHSCFIKPPRWADSVKKTIQIANHVFYKLGDK